MSISFKESDRFDVVGLREHINRKKLGELIALSGDQAKIASQCGRIAGDGNNALWCKPGKEGSGFAQPLAWWIKEDAVEAAVFLYKGTQLMLHAGCDKVGRG